jgi:hypothetical protein
MTRWDNKSKDARDLESMFSRGMIAVDAKASFIRASNPLWVAKYDAGQFRNAFNRIKKNHEKVSLRDPSAATGKVDCCFYAILTLLLEFCVLCV